MKRLPILILLILCGCATPPYTREQEVRAYKEGYKAGVRMSNLPIMRHHYWPRQYELKPLREAWYRGYYDGLGFTTPENPKLVEPRP